MADGCILDSHLTNKNMHGLLFLPWRGFPQESSSAMFGAELWLSAQSLLEITNTHNQRVVPKNILRHCRKHESSVRTFWAVLSLRALFLEFLLELPGHIRPQELPFRNVIAIRKSAMSSWPN